MPPSSFLLHSLMWGWRTHLPLLSTLSPSGAKGISLNELTNDSVVAVVALILDLDEPPDVLCCSSSNWLTLTGRGAKPLLGDDA